ncbi:MAG: hypothetical protein KJZ55_06155 [Flavobacteriales bacterium]|nr:hypothetical protein [Flavobacteriales bacterium]
MKLNLTNSSIWLVFLTAFVITISLQNWKKQDRVIEHDVHAYYEYLPLLFIYDDIKIEKSDYRFGDNYYFIWISHVSDKGVKVIKASCGLSILYAPFFFIAHGVALLTDYPANGFSEPYKVFLLISTLFYLFIGLNFLKKILNSIGFNDKHSAITILAVGLGTNLLAYSSQSAPNPHTYNFALFAIFIYYTIKWYEKQSYKATIILAFLFGLIALIRPSNVIIIFFFIFYGISSWTDIKERFFLFKKEFVKLLFFAVIPLFVWFPQFWYWKIVSGKFLYYSYNEEGFYFTDPKILEGLFSFRKGWLIYTPIMAFSIIGLYFLKDKLKKLLVPISIFTVLNIYIIFSWWCWWYGGTYGQRVMIDSYAMLAIPLAAFVKYADDKRIVNYLFYGITLFFIWLNIFQTYQFENQCLHYDSMSSKLYFKQFGIMHRKVDFEKYLDWADYDAAKYRGNKVKEKSSIISKDSQKVNLIAFNGKYLCTEWDRSIIADKDVANAWEVFIVNIFDKNEISIVAYDEYLLSADLGMNGEVTATRKEKHSWETFIIEYLEPNIIAIKAENGKYFSVDSNTLKISATAETIGEKEQFKLVKLEN